MNLLPIVCRICGTKKPHGGKSTRQFLYVVFRADHSHSHNGFKLTVTEGGMCTGRYREVKVERGRGR